MVGQWRGVLKLVLCVLGLLTAASCTPLPTREPLLTFVPPPTAPASELSSTFTVRRGDITESLQVRGRVVAARESLLVFEEEGWLSKFHVKAGDQVSKGQLLAELNAPGLEERVLSARYTATADELSVTRGRKAAEAGDLKLQLAEKEQARQVLVYQKALTDAQKRLDQAKEGAAKQELTFRRTEAGQRSRVLQAEQALSDSEKELRQAWEEAKALEAELVQATFAFTQTKIALERAYPAFQKVAYYGGGTEYESALSALEAAERNYRSATARIERLKVEREKNKLSIAQLAEAVAKARAQLDLAQQIAEVLAEENEKARELAQADIERVEVEVAANEELLRAAQKIADLQEEQHELTRRVNDLDIALLQEKASYSEARLGLLEARWTGTELYAPYSGLIISVDAKPGDHLDPFEPIGAMADPTELGIEVNVPEADLERVAVGQIATIVLDSYPNNVYQGAVAGVSFRSITWQGKKVYPVQVQFEKPEEVPAVVRMGTELSIVTSHKKNVILVPSRTTYTEGHSTFVEVLRGSSGQKVEVQTGISDGQFTEIVSGLLEGQQVVIS